MLPSHMSVGNPGMIIKLTLSNMLKTSPTLKLGTDISPTQIPPTYLTDHNPLPTHYFSGLRPVILPLTSSILPHSLLGLLFLEHHG